MLSSRERLLYAINNEKPDRLPCQVHQWQPYYLNTYLNGIDQFEAYFCFGMDAVIYIEPQYVYSAKAASSWCVEHKELGKDSDGKELWVEMITTPEAMLVQRGARNRFTQWFTEYLIKNEFDFEIWNKYVPVPEKVDWSPVVKAKERIGDRGIVRSSFFDFGQGSPWQSFCYLFGTEQAIMAAIDKPDWIHYVLESMLGKKLVTIERAGKFELDLVETGGGAGSSTVISPALYREFCLAYDCKQHEALRDAGTKTVYHLCGGLMPLLDIVAVSGADGLETMTPPSMGGDCDLALANKLVGDKLFFVGGIDQNAGFERGTPDIVRQLVYQCHSACPNGGYICSPSDHFFFGKPENIQALVDACKECTY